MKHNLLNIFVVATMGLAFGTLGLFGYWFFAPYNPLDVVQPLPVATKQVRSGDHLSLEFDYCNRMAVPVISKANFYRRGPTTDHLVDTIEATTSKPTISKIQCQKISNDKYIIPPNYIPGEYYLKIIVIYQVNPLRSVREDIISEHFFVQ